MKKQPHRYERMNPHLAFLFNIVLAFVIEQFPNPAIPFFSKVFGSLFFLAVPILLIRRDYNAMIQRRQFIESFFPDDYWLEA